MVCKNRLLLINPWQTYPKKLASEYQSYVPYGIACIASIGIMQGFDVKIIDCLVDDTETDLGEFVRYGKNENDLRNEIISFAPDIVGISCIFSMFEKDATDIASLVKSIDSRIIVILGGVTATLPEIYEPLLSRTDTYDLMVRGEGEEIFAEILKRYCKEQKTIIDKSEIKGIAFKTTDGIVSTDPHPFIRNLDALPFPALELLDIDKMLGNKYYSRWRNNPANKRSFPIFTSRGCPYNCCFCSVHSQVGYRYRMYSIDYVIELMKKCIVCFGINHFHFEDDNLTLDVNRAKRLFKEMASLNISWDTPNGVRADKIDEEMIQLMIASGLSSLSIAAESGNETVRTNIIHKRLTTDSIINAVRLCDKYDLPCIVFFVLGFPGETYENIRETIQFAKNISELYGTINMIFIANPLPGTELSRDAKNKGYIKKDLENADYFVAIRANQAPIIATEEFDKKSIFFLLQEELDLPDYSVHNITQPMFWYNSQKANLRAYRAFPKMSNRKVDWKWVDEQ